MSKFLTGKTVLFLCPCFYTYHIEIIKALKSEGAAVDFFKDMSEEYFYKLSRKSTRLLHVYRKYYERHLLNKIESKRYDILFVIRGEILSADFVTRMKTMCSVKYSVLYEWDSINVIDYQHLIPVFDNMYSFDMADCNTLHCIRYLPLFYLDRYQKVQEDTLSKRDIDLLFVGSWHTDRYEILEKIETEARGLHLSVYFYLYLPLPYFIKLCLKGMRIKTKHVRFKPLNQDQIECLFKRSHCIVDLSRQNQTGSTMRTMETLGAGRKLITTNKNILKEPFYDSRRISIIDTQHPVIDPLFVKRTSVTSIVPQYHIIPWLKTMLDKRS